MHYTRTGGTKQPLILLHGLMTSGVCCWADLVQVLEGEYDVIMPDAKSRHPDRSEKTNIMFAQARLQTIMAAFDVLNPPNPDYKGLVKSIDVPCFLVFGDRGVVASAGAEELHDIKPSLKVEEIQNAGHSVHRDPPEHFANAIKHFIQSIQEKR